MNYNFSHSDNIINQVEIHPDRLNQLGFNQVEVNTLKTLISTLGKVTVAKLVSQGISYDAAYKLKYAYDICIGKVKIDGVEDLSTHLRKMFGKYKRIGISDLAVSRVREVPRKAVIAGIKDQTFAIYNSKNTSANDLLYDVVSVAGNRVVIETTKKPVLKYKQSKSIEGVIELLGVDSVTKKVQVAINKEYIKLCNRYVIVASLKRPEFYLGMVEVICVEGTKVYIYANNIGTKASVSYHMGTQRVYDYGFFANDIKNKLRAVAVDLCNTIHGVHATEIEGNQDFILIPKDNIVESELTE